jgi:pyrroloquinoline quinone biosynthesis protein B
MLGAHVPAHWPLVLLLIAANPHAVLPQDVPGANPQADRSQIPDAPYLVVLGIAQDGGVPQAGTRDHRGWDEPAYRRLATSLAIVDPMSGERWLFEATPDFREQLHRLDEIAPTLDAGGLTGVFLTHGHIGHYTGLMYLGHESMGAQKVPVFAMPRMRSVLQRGAPWSQLVRYGNIEFRRLANGVSVELNDRLRVTPFLVPHRQEYSEVVGFRIEGPDRTVLFLPDIDSWEEWDRWGVRLEDVLETVDVAYLDATFYADGEIPGRDMSGFPHPLITHTMRRLADLPESERAKVRFIHLNHTNPALWEDSDARREIERRGFRVAEEGERLEL